MNTKKKQQEYPSYIPAVDGEWCETALDVQSIVYRILVKRVGVNNYLLLMHQAIVEGDCRGTPLYIFRGITSIDLVMEMIQLFSSRRN